MPDRIGVIFLIYNDGKVLLEKRTTLGKGYYGYTIIPGGKVETGETFDQAARREIWEECGIDVVEMYPLDRFLHFTPSKHLYDTTAFIVMDYNNDPINIEGKSDHVWVDINKALELLIFGDSRDVIRAAKEFLISRGRLKD